MSRRPPILQSMVVVAAAMSILAVPLPALACAVCSGGSNDASQAGFLAGTILLSILPLALFGGLGFWIYRRMQQMAREAAAPETPQTPNAPPARAFRPTAR